MDEALSLYQLNRMVAHVVTQHFNAPLWVIAEIAQISNTSTGHCYLDLVEKDEKSGQTTARARAAIWSNRWWLIRETFEQGTGQRLQNGMKVLIQVQVNMHEQYGYTLVVTDIDPNYTVGEMQRKRQEIIKRLTDEGMIDVNKGIPLPRPLQRIAIVSANNAAGYGDFCHQLENNEYGLKFYTHLFPAALQGEQTVSSVIQALDRIYQHQELFDVVVIIRGGGSVVDLNSFDDYTLALNIANFPLPVIVGIGHERDNTVLDIVAHTSVKTPTAAAALLIEMMANELYALEQFQTRISELTRGGIERENLRLVRLTNAVQNTHIRLGQQINQLSLMRERIAMLIRLRMEKEQQQLNYIQRTISLAQPDNILSRGFSITRLNGKAVKDASLAQPGDILETQTASGIIKSEVK